MITDFIILALLDKLFLDAKELGEVEQFNSWSFAGS
jgi:hypothetical protein